MSVYTRKHRGSNSLPLGPKNLTQNSFNPPSRVTSCLLSILSGGWGRRGKQEIRKIALLKGNPVTTYNLITSVSMRRFPALGDDIVVLLVARV